jgi:hypothetical protein
MENEGSVGDHLSFNKFDMSSGTIIAQSAEISGLSSCRLISLDPSPSGRLRGEEITTGVPFQESSSLSSRL